MASGPWASWVAGPDAGPPRMVVTAPAVSGAVTTKGDRWVVWAEAVQVPSLFWLTVVARRWVSPVAGSMVSISALAGRVVVVPAKTRVTVSGLVAKDVWRAPELS